MSEVGKQIIQGLEEAVTLKQITEIFKGTQLDRLRAIAEAERDGRLVIRPFKDGQTVFVISEGTVFTCNIEYAGNDCVAVSEETFYVCAIDDSCACVADVVTEKDKGVTVFETREAAETALAGKGET